MKPTRVFVRADDLGLLSDPLRRVLEFHLERGVGVDYQVVPTFLDQSSVDHVRQLALDQPRLVRLPQHGYAHGHDTPEGEHVAELSGHQPYERQHELIAAGRQVLRDAFGPAFAGTVFTPPQHKYDATTVRVLDELGFTALSASVFVEPRARAYYALGRALRRVDLLDHNVSYHGRRIPRTTLCEVSVSVNVDMDERGRRVRRSGPELVEAYEQAARSLPIFGLMLHHECYEDADQFAALGHLYDHIAATGAVMATIDDIVASLP